MKLALHRSITFWSGILVTGFICWAWWDSDRYFNMMSWKRMIVGSAANGCFVIVDPVGRGSIETMRIDISSVPLWYPTTPNGPIVLRSNGGTSRKIASDSFEDKMQAHLDSVGPGHWFGFSLYWLLLLAVALPWSAPLLWRARRRKRAAPTTA